MAARIALALALTLTLGACGDEVPSGFPARFDPSDAAGVGKAMTGALDSAFAVVLDDAALAGLLATHRRVLAAGGDVQAALAAGGSAGRFLDYSRALIKWKAMTEGARGGAGRVQRTAQELDDELAQLEAQVQAAEGNERERLLQQLTLQRRVRANLATSAVAVEKLATPEVRALVAKWQPRFDAVEAEFDE